MLKLKFKRRRQLVKTEFSGLESQFYFTWLRFKQHKLAVVSLVFLVVLYFVALCSGFFQTQDSQHYLADYALAPPQRVHLIDDSHFRPFVYGYKSSLSRESGKKIYEIDPNTKNYVRFFGPAEKPYKLLGIIPMNVRLIAPQNYDVPFFLLGSDRQGRDLFSRLLSGARVSLTIGLVGVFLSLILGVIIGGISGYFGGAVDNVIQRFIELMRSLPTIPLWLALSVAIPKSWDPLTVYFAISVILSFITWTGMARAVRGRFLALKSQDFIAAAKLDGAGPMRIVGKHMTPLFVSHIIAEMTLSIPTMILGETALSFLGVGLQPPVESWGVLLQQAKSVTVLASAPWLLLPGLFIVVTVLAMNFLGDGLRDAADPYRT